MTAVNPYEASRLPSAPSSGQPVERLGLKRCFTIVLVSAGLGALGGLFVGMLLGLVVPDYYHAVFGNPRLNAVQVGAGLGFTQGLGAGIAVGCVVVLAVAISRRRQPAASV